MSQTPRERPSGTFGEYVERSARSSLASAEKGSAPPAPERWGDVQKWQLLLDGNPIGFLGQNSDQWCIVVPKIEDAVPLETYREMSHGSTSTYYRNAANPERYLSTGLSLTYYVGFYNWLMANEWWHRGQHYEYVLKPYGGRLSYWGPEDNFLYANEKPGYKVLSIHFIPV